MQAKRVDFYILESGSQDEQISFICRLIEKIYLTGHQIYVSCDTIEHAHQLDEALWTFKAESFIPHHLQGEGPMPPSMIQLGIQSPASSFKDILINQGNKAPDFYLQFKRTIEIVGGSEEQKQSSREKYRYYQSQGCVIHTHKIQSQLLKEESRENA